VNQAYPLPDRYFVHWYTEPATGKWLESSAKFNATTNCMSATTGQVQKRYAPIAAIPRKNSVKMPVDGEM
jgi:hypothetical protein